MEMKAKSLERTAKKAINLLRKKKLSQGVPFMINSTLLPSHECFLEYPNGLIEIIRADPEACDFKVVEKLNPISIKLLRGTLKLKPFNY